MWLGTTPDSMVSLEQVNFIQPQVEGAINVTSMSKYFNCVPTLMKVHIGTVAHTYR